MTRKHDKKEGAVAVVVRDGRLLVIRRSPYVVAPGAYCFPGGGIEAGETQQEALCREMEEELGVPARPVRRLWSSLTPWKVHLAWWLAELPDPPMLTPCPREVASVHWFTPEQMRLLPELLESNRQFLAAWSCGEFVIDGVLAIKGAAVRGELSDSDD